jgi:DNA-binding transcriptional LysR family regulator
MANLIEDGIDLAVRIGKLADSSLIARPLGLTRRVVVASPDYLKRMGEPKDPRELGAHGIIRFMGFDGSLDWRFVREGRQERHSVGAQFTTNSADAAIGHALAGGGLAMVLAYQAAPELREGRLRVVLGDFEPPPAPIQLVYPTARLLSAKVRAFIDLAVETADWQFIDFGR